jgi:hypothetical protein
MPGVVVTKKSVGLRAVALNPTYGTTLARASGTTLARASGTTLARASGTTADLQPPTHGPEITAKCETLLESHT